MPASWVDMAPTAKVIVEEVLGIQKGEQVAILTDTQRPESITQLLATAVRLAGAEALILTIKPAQFGGVDPPRPARAAVEAADAVICQASYAIAHTETVRTLLRKGGRLCDMWGFTEDMMTQGAATADYQEVRRLSEAAAAILTKGKEARLTTPDGTNLVLSLEGRTAGVLAGFATTPGVFCAFP